MAANDGKTMSDDEMWRAIENRDASFDGRFVVAVRTTGVYCRPSCPSKHPKRENVNFYQTPEAAEAAGYRPCLRCKPRERDAPQLAWVKKACDYIRRNEGEKITLDDLAAEVGVSAAHLQRTFKHVMGLTPRQYQEVCRVERLKQRLRQGEPVTKAVYGVGYGSTSWLYKDANAKLGMTPGAYRRAGEGMKIRYRVVDSPLGRLLVARTSHGVCHLSLGDGDANQEEALRREYPAAEITKEEGKPDPWTIEVLDYLAGRATQLGDIPLDVTGTEFQRRVWKELQAIPWGSIRSYEDVARSIGQPTAARAVSRACATNPVSIIIPCHRVVRKGGGLGGYRWGIERKRRLLESEGPPKISGSSMSPFDKPLIFPWSRRRMRLGLGGLLPLRAILLRILCEPRDPPLPRLRQGWGRASCFFWGSRCASSSWWREASISSRTSLRLLSLALAEALVEHHGC